LFHLVYVESGWVKAGQACSSDLIGFYDGNADTLIALLELVQETACQILDVLTPACRLE
jgi:hypothetical protein